MKRSPVEDVLAFCANCREAFTYRANLPTQRYCMECYYAHQGDFTGAIEELAWKAGYQHGVAEASTPEDRCAERVAKLLDLLPLRDVIALCHPDRQPPERSKQATTVTATLLELKAVLEERRA